MADAVKKFLEKVQSKERAVLVELITSIVRGETIRGAKKLAGTKNTFRVRKGTCRIIYEVKENGNSIVSVERRSEKTYRDF